jgi:hypothetical protein
MPTYRVTVYRRIDDVAYATVEVEHPSETPDADPKEIVTAAPKYDAAGLNQVAVENVGRRGSASYAVHFTPTRPVHLRNGGTYTVHLAAPLLLGRILARES